MSHLSLINTMLIEHQRMNPHYEQVCELCRRAQEAIAAAGAENDFAVVVAGPPGQLMSTNAELLRRHFGKRTVIANQRIALCNLPSDALYLTERPVTGAIPFDIALAAAIHR